MGLLKCKWNFEEIRGRLLVVTAQYVENAKQRIIMK